MSFKIKRTTKYFTVLLLCLTAVLLGTVCIYAACTNPDCECAEDCSCISASTSFEETTVPVSEETTAPNETAKPQSQQSLADKLGITLFPSVTEAVDETGDSAPKAEAPSQANNTSFLSVTKNLFVGFGTSLKIFFFTLLFSLPLGLIISFGTMSKWKPLSAVTRIFVWIVRGTPLMLQLFVFAYYNLFLPWLPPCTFDKRIYIAVIAFVINYACYFSEIYRSGIESMPKGQYEAAAVLGMTKSETFFKVILFQVVKKIVPPIGNEIITLVKDTSLVRVIMVYELMWEAEKYLLRGLLWPIFYTGVFYLLFSGLLTVLFGYIEKKMDYYRE